MSIGLQIVVFLAAIFVPLGIFIFIFRDLIFRGTGTESARVMMQEGRKRDREAYFIRCFRSFPESTNVYIVAGEANPSFYTEGVVRAMEQAADRGIKIKVICGPTIIGKGDGELKSGILDLAEKKKIDLFLSKKRQIEHFRVSTTGRLYYELEHMPGQKGSRIGFNIPNNYFESKPYLKKFERLIGSEYVKKSEHPYSDFILVTEEEQFALTDRILSLGKNYNECNIDDLRKSLEEIRSQSQVN